MNKLSHIDGKGNITMVDIAAKKATHRVARAQSGISMNDEAYSQLKAGLLKKGDALTTAKVAGIMAAKKTADFIPLCHPLSLNNVDIEFAFDDGNQTVEIYATASVTGKTGVEMEALMAANMAALTLYDMCKAVDKHMIIKESFVYSKEGGKRDFCLDNP